VLTLEGKPVAGAVVHLSCVYAPDGKNGLKEVYEMWPTQPGRAAHLLQKFLNAPAAAGLPDKVTADADGRFELTGVGDGRLLMLQITADSIEHQYVLVATDPGFDPRTARPTPDPQIIYAQGVGPPLYGPRFDHAAGPCRILTGTVRDRETGKPLANVGVSAHLLGSGWWENSAHTRTGADGKYRLVGLPNAECKLDFIHFISATQDSPYLMLSKSVGPTEGLTPATCDLAMVRGVVLTGRVTDAATGKPVKSFIRYAPLAGNKAVLQLPGEDIHARGSMTHALDADGRYRVVAPPGLGIVLVMMDDRNEDQKPYPLARLRPEDRGNPAFQSLGERDETFQTVKGVIHFLSSFRGYQLIDPPEGTEALTVDFRLDPGKALTGTVVGPEGKPVAGATLVGLTPGWREPDRLNGDTFTAQALTPGEGRPVAAAHADKKLGGTAQLSADEKDPPVLRLVPWGTVSGRLLDPDGKPVSGASVRLGYSHRAARELHRHLTNDKAVATDADGRFRLEVSFTESKFSLTFGRKSKPLDVGEEFRQLTVAAGQVKDLGDISVKVEE
jgi:protocatechuate 3,4-dioxygenase beta subunit